MILESGPGKIVFLLASSTDGAVGDGEKLLWHLPEDLRRFKELTMGHPCILGRKTLESIGRVLPGRRFLVLTREIPAPESPLYQRYPGVEWYTDFGRALAHLEGMDHPVWVIGGAEIYRLMEEQADCIERTEVDGVWPEAAARFVIRSSVWTCVLSSEWHQSINGLRYRYQRYLKIRP